MFGLSLPTTLNWRRFIRRFTSIAQARMAMTARVTPAVAAPDSPEEDPAPSAGFTEGA